ncbi:hypothetical protein ACWGR4_13585 [Embleya sp. NPDC055664]
MTVRRWSVGAVVAAGVMLGVSGCGGSGDDPFVVSAPSSTAPPSTAPPSTAPPVRVHATRVDTGTVAFEVRAAGGTDAGARTVTTPCDRVLLALDDVTIESNEVTCKAPGGPPGNGWHGLYRTAADVPPGAVTQTVQTPLGEAVLFTQEYYEATNSVRRWREPVAIVTLGNPRSRNHPTLVVRADKGGLDQSRLAGFVRANLLPLG